MKQLLILLSLPLLVAACQSDAEKTAAAVEPPAIPRYTEMQTGGAKMIPVTTPAGSFNVWTKRMGDNPSIKVLLLHGGPAVPHEYFECFENFLLPAGIEFIYYDQLGCGNSDIPKDTSLWELPRFVEEVEQVRQALGLTPDNFYLLGHSWGGILAMEYALKYQKNLKGLIISNMMSDAPAYGRYAQEVLAKQMVPAALDSIRAIEARKDFKNPRYMELLMPHFYEQHILRLPTKNWPDPVNRAFARMNSEIYTIMQGPSEFGISGKLVRWSRSADLKTIQVPTLVVGATHDTMDPAHMQWMAEQLPNGSFLLCSNGSHMAFYDDQQTYFEGLIGFLRR